jgi:HD-GYP domain-containing protein (c-di-GMP phosphodiesterase class II)
MSSGPLRDAPSRAAEGPPTEEFELSLPSLVRLRGTALIEGLERHAPGAAEHADATASYAFAAAAELGIDRRRADLIREAAKLHEVGLVYVPAEALRKRPSELSEDERGALAVHSESGAQLARGAGIPDTVCDWILRWTERFDGSVSAGVEGEQIPLEARIINAACACDASLAAPGTEPAERPAAAAAALRRMAGSRLDPSVVEALVAVLERTSGRR